MKHKKFEYVKELIKNKMQLMLEGEAGSGKTTMLMQIAEELKLDFYSITGTQQTSVANLLGFQSVTGEYIPTQLRQAYEFGGLFLADEYDGFNPNTILALNTIENGFLAFPDKVIKAHPDFIMCATVNPDNQHASFTGRSKQDAAALDRFLNIPIDRDPNLETTLTSKEAVLYANKMRELLLSHGVITRIITMRDTMRFFKLLNLYKNKLIDENPLSTLVGKNLELKEELYAFKSSVDARTISLNTTTNIDELFDLIKKKKGL